MNNEHTLNFIPDEAAPVIGTPRLMCPNLHPWVARLNWCYVAVEVQYSILRIMICGCYSQDILLDKFAQRGPSCVAYDEKMHFYASVGADIASQVLETKVDFALLHMEPLARALQENARCWVTSLGKFLNESARDGLMNLDRQLAVSKKLIGGWYLI